MNNEWATPEGYATQPPPVRYTIRRYIGEYLDPGFRYGLKGRPDPNFTLGDVETHQTMVTYVVGTGVGRYYHALALADQMFTDQIVRLVQSACAYFYAADADYVPLEGAPEIEITDGDVKIRIARLNRGENAREARRTRRDAYDLEALPWAQQRALVEQLDRLKAEWGFAILGEAAAPAPAAPWAPAATYGDGDE